MKIKNFFIILSTGDYQLPFFRGKRILFRTAVMSWLLIIITLGLYIFFTVPFQRKVAVDRMKLQAKSIASSISEVTANAIILEDYSFTVEHCMRIISENPSLSYIVITKKDGFSLCHRTNYWKTDTLGGYWTAPNTKEDQFLVDPENHNTVFHYVYPFEYSGIQWGWIHIGLNIIQFNKEIAEIYKRTLLLGLTCILIGLGVSILFAKQLIHPIQQLDSVTRDFASGNLNKRVHITTGDELQHLADSFNIMANALQKSHSDLEKRVKERTNELAQINTWLEKEIIERKNAEKLIKASLQEKEILLTEIHHRVKNNLQIVSSLLYLQSRNIKDENLIGHFQESQNRIRSMALIHEKLYKSENMANINIADYIKSLTSYLFHVYNNHKRIELITDIDNVYLTVEQAICCGLIVNELVSNSLKYAFTLKKEGNIWISLESGILSDDKQNEQYTLIVKDNGIGLDESITFQNVHSLGLQLVNNLSTQLNGFVNVERNGGTCFNITFQSGKNGKSKKSG